MRVRPARAGARHRRGGGRSRSCTRRRASSPTRPCTTRSPVCPTGRWCSTAPQQMLARTARQPGMRGRCAVRRHRRLQARQRQPRARRRRPAAAGRRRTAAGRRARAGHRRAPRRRRVRRAGRVERRRAVGRHARRPADRGAARAGRARRRPRIFSVTASIGVAVGPVRHARRPAARRRPGPVRRQGARARTATRCSTPACTPTSKGASRSRRDLGGGAAARSSSSSSTSRSSTCASGSVVGVEALIRWRHPVRGIVPPDELHPARRGDRPDRPDRPLGARAGLPAGGGLGKRRQRDRRSPSTSRPHQLGPQRVRRRRAARARESGLDPSPLTLEITETTLDARRRSGARDHLRGGQGTRRARRDRRLRHRLRLALAPAADAGRHPQDRPQLRRRARRRRPEPRPARGDPRRRPARSR